MRTRGADEYRWLTDKLSEVTPACHGDWRMIAESHEIDAADIASMRSRCINCPLFQPCAEYARAARPPAGMWAGTYYPRSTQGKETPCSTPKTPPQKRNNNSS